jgi:hypothetical protein
MGEQQYQRPKQPEQQKPRQVEQQRDFQTPGQQTTTHSSPYSVSTTAPQAPQKNKPTLKMGELKCTAGRAGERSITLEKFWVQVGNAFPCGFKVGTLPENELEVTMEQLAYRKVYSGRGGLTTQVIPVVPVGTPGRVIARDITTGEVVEQPWKWHYIGPFSRFWESIKNLLFKPS